LTFSHLPPWQGARLAKRAKYEAMAARALTSLNDWMLRHGLTPRLGADQLLVVPGLAPAAPQVAIEAPEAPVEAAPAGIAAAP
jgi:hypothetical protein